MGFCHILPTNYLHLVAGRENHLTLAHLVEEDPIYEAFYATEANNGSQIIMDNSAFEMYKQGKPMYESSKLIEMGRRCGAHYIAMSDFPGEDALKTITAAQALAPGFREAGFGTFFIPQSRIGEVEELVDAFLWAAESDDVDYIGYSILAIPNAYGVEKGNKLQRFIARTRFVQRLNETGFFQAARRKKHHFLGMVDGPNEIELIKAVFPYNLDTWDSSAAGWAGLNGIKFDGSPTGLLDGKFEREVAFHCKDATSAQISTAVENIHYIDDMWNKTTEEGIWL